MTSEADGPGGIDGTTFTYTVTGVSIGSGGSGYDPGTHPNVKIYGGGTYLGTLTANVSGGSVVSVNLTPTITRSYLSHTSSEPTTATAIWHHLTAVIDPPPNLNGVGSGAAATATVDGSGGIQSISVTNGGANYSVIPPIVIISAPTALGGIQAIAVASVAGGVVTGVTIINNGSGYTGGTPTVTFVMPPIQTLDIEQGAVQNSITIAYLLFVMLCAGSGPYFSPMPTGQEAYSTIYQVRPISRLQDNMQVS